MSGRTRAVLARITALVDKWPVEQTRIPRDLGHALKQLKPINPTTPQEVRCLVF